MQKEARRRIPQLPTVCSRTIVRRLALFLFDHIILKAHALTGYYERQQQTPTTTNNNKHHQQPQPPPPLQ
jgi:hypothetical protein